MNPYRTGLRQSQITAARRSHLGHQQWIRHASRSASGPPRRGGKLVGFMAIFALSAGAVYYYPKLFPPTDDLEQTESGLEKAELVFPKSRIQPVSKENNRDIISSQHLQVKKSWENPGVYAWGSNAGKVIDPNSKDAVVKVPRRIAYFDGQLLRDLKLSQQFGAAVTENGDIVQWGAGYSATDPTPATTLRGKDITRIAVSSDRVIGLSSSGSVYSIPASREDLLSGAKQVPESGSSSWIPFWSSGSWGTESASYRILAPKGLSRGERIVDVSSGLDHCLMLTSSGRVFAAASSTADFPSKGQLGIPGLGWRTRPEGAFDQPHEITTLRGFDIVKVATGDYHSVVLDRDGKIFSFGDNMYGQLGFESEPGFETIDVPSLLPVNKLYTRTGLVPTVTSIAAGGQTTFFTVDAALPANQTQTDEVAPGRRLPRVTADTWACGQGIYGALGTGKWTHISSKPNKLTSLSSLFEFDEKTNKLVPIRLSYLAVGSTHASAIMDNVTRTGASNWSSENDINWGADVVFWGGNEYYQLGTGKRSNLNSPTYIGPLDGGKGDAEKGRKGETHRLQITPRQNVRLGKDGQGRKVSVEQRVECGKYTTAVYSGV